MSEIEKRKAGALEGAIVDGPEQVGSRSELEVGIASELLERAKSEGVSLVGQGGLLASAQRPRRSVRQRSWSPAGARAQPGSWAPAAADRDGVHRSSGPTVRGLSRDSFRTCDRGLSEGSRPGLLQLTATAEHLAKIRARSCTIARSWGHAS